MLEVIAVSLVFLGLAFFAAGSVGLLRLPDLYCRLHALTKADNLGLGFVATGLALLSGDALVALKLALVWLLVLAGSAAAAHLIAQRAVREDRADG